MSRLLLTSAERLRTLPDGAVLTGPAGQRLVWLRAYARPHPDPDTGLWTLPRNPFTEWQVCELDVELPDGRTSPLSGDETWLGTLTDPHDSTRDR